MPNSLNSTISRRSLLQGSLTLSAAGAAMALVGCGGGKTAKSTATTAAPKPQQPLASSPTTAAAWKQLSPTGASPPARRDHSMTLASDNGLIYMFGGRKSGTSLDDLWSFDPKTSTWTEISISGAKPAPRFTQNAFYDASARRLVIALGQGTDGALYDDVWAFDPAASSWQQLDADSPEHPEIRYGSGSGYDAAGGRLLITHGFTDNGRFDDTWQFDLATKTWTKIKTSGALPIKRCLLHSLWLPTTNQLLMFGGQTNDNPFLGDFWSLDPKSGKWFELKPTPLPGPRNLYGEAISAAGDSWYLFGGNTPDGPSGELWSYNIAHGTWQQVVIATGSLAPSARYSASAITVQNRLLVFAGNDDKSELDDLWSLDLAS